jgi:hypothetical protein
VRSVSTKAEVTKSNSQLRARLQMSRRTRQCTIAIELIFITCGLIIGNAHAQQRPDDVKVFGVTRADGFNTTGTDMVCKAIDAGRCWDGNKWHALFPGGPRIYAAPTSDEIACVAIAQGDCWTGTEWYRLPSGQNFRRKPTSLRGGHLSQLRLNLKWPPRGG